MAREPCSLGTLPRKYCPSSTTKGLSTTSLMRIMALSGDRVGDPLHTNRGKIEIFPVFMGFKALEGVKGISEIG